MGNGEWQARHRGANKRINAALATAEQKSYNLPYEVGTLIGNNGEVLLEKTDQSDKYVEFTESQCAMMAGMTYTHNHPNNSIFSDGDVKFLADNGLKTIRATAGDKVYQLTQGNGNTDGQKLAADYHSFMSNRRHELNAGEGTKLLKQWADDKITQKQYDKGMDKLELQWFNDCARWLRQNANNYGYKFSTLHRG